MTGARPGNPRILSALRLARDGIMGASRMAVPLALAAMMAAGACGGTDVLEIQGQIEEVNARSIITLESLTIRDETGKIWTFNSFAQGFVGFTPSHLLEHQALAKPIIVFYTETPDGFMALRVTD